MSKILVIEDDLEFSQALCKALRKSGYDVLFAENGQKGIDLYKRFLADLVITDILMPEKDGIEVIVDLKKHFPNIKIIAISGGGSAGSGLEYLRSAEVVCDVRHTLAKPFKRDRLFQMIEEVLG